MSGAPEANRADVYRERNRRIVAVVVTYNRRDLLMEALSACVGQTVPPSTVVVVDNASSDQTAATVRRRHPDVDLLELPRNAGGAGGFAAGIARALELDADLIWLMDDDAIAEPLALQRLLEVYERAGALPTLVASRVLWTDGRAHPMNTPRVKPMAAPAERAAAATLNCVPIRSASFVSILLDAAAVRQCGLPVADYFLWNDDFEFTTRLLRGGAGLLCHDSVVVHKTKTFGAADADPGPRFFYEVRNKIWLFTRSGCLAPGERALYAAATLRRWARMLAVSGDRAGLLRQMCRGIGAGIFAGPRPTSVVLRSLGISPPAAPMTRGR